MRPRNRGVYRFGKSKMVFLGGRLIALFPKRPGGYLRG